MRAEARKSNVFESSVEGKELLRPGVASDPTRSSDNIEVV